MGAAYQIVGGESRCLGMFLKMICPARLELIGAAALTSLLGIFGFFTYAFDSTLYVLRGCQDQRSLYV